MTDTIEMKRLIRIKGFTLETLAKAIGISKTTLSYKINNQTEFNAREIKRIQIVLGLTDKQRDYIFFKQE